MFESNRNVRFEFRENSLDRLIIVNYSIFREIYLVLDNRYFVN